MLLEVRSVKLQDMAEISQNQLHSVQAQQHAREREMKSLRQQLKEFQLQTDEHALIGEETLCNEFLPPDIYAWFTSCTLHSAGLQKSFDDEASRSRDRS